MQLEKKAEECHPALIVAGASAYSRIIDFERFRKIADKVGAKLMVDMAHIAGLVAAGLHPSPLPFADITTTTTHKTLRGPRGGMILTSRGEEYGKNINSKVFPGIQGGPLMHVIAAKAVALGEALRPEFKEYQAADSPQRQGAGLLPHRRGLRSRVRRHGQPPHACRSHQKGHHRQGRRTRS